MNLLGAGSSAGTIQVFDDASPARSVFGTYVFRGGNLNVAGGQLIDGGTFLGIANEGAGVLGLSTSALAAPLTVTLIITESFA